MGGGGGRAEGLDPADAGQVPAGDKLLSLSAAGHIV